MATITKTTIQVFKGTTVTTAAQSQSTIAITGIQDVTPVSAVVTLSYGSGS